MGAHGTLEEALNNVASFRSASRTDHDVASRSSKSSKHKSHKKHKKSKEKIKDKKDGSKRHKKQKRSSSPSSSEEDDSEAPVDLQTQLAKGREAVRITRSILFAHPDMRSDLREVIRVGRLPLLPDCEIASFNALSNAAAAWTHRRRCSPFH